MFFLNLSLPEFLALFTAVSGLVVTLYLLSRARRRQVVSTLRFWSQAKQPVVSARRRRIQQPWSLVLQLLSLALLLLAIAQLRLGDREKASRDHVLLLDASTWMGAKSGSGTLLDQARVRARAWLRSLPSSDRVMVVRADGLPSPVTGMEKDRATVERAIEETRPGASALNLDQAFLFADQIRSLHGSTGEIVYVGAGRLGAAGVPTRQPAGLRVIEVKSPSENYGLSRVGVRRSDTDPEAWEIFVSVRNYTAAAKRLPLTISFGGAPAGSTLVDVPAAGMGQHTFQLRTRAAGWVEARLLVRDALDEDNRTILELPELKTLRVAVFTDDAEAIRPAMVAHPQIQASYYSPSQYRPETEAQVVVFDRFSPSVMPKVPAVWLEPPDNSPFRTRSRISEQSPVTWRAEAEIGSGIRTRNLRLNAGQVFSATPDDVVIASVSAGPVALARPSRRMVALGFNPGRSEMRYDLATPLLMANIMRWLQPDVFRTAEVHGGSVGAVTMPLDAGVDRTKLRVLADGQELPFTVQGNSLRFFAGSPGVVRVLSPAGEQVHSLSLPEVAERNWEPPSSARRGMPGLVEQAASRDLWQILAVLGTLGLLLEWVLYGRRRNLLQTGMPFQTPGPAASSWRRAS